jgi:transposase-like protein
MRYPTELKDKAIKRLLETERPSINQLSQDLDVPEVTLYYWDRQIKNGRMGKTNRRPQSLSEKQQLIYEYQSLSEEDKGIWLRENGFYSSHLESWKKEITEALDGTKEYPKKEKAWKKETERLTKELTKKEKALAEVTALLVLKKKLDALFGEDPEENK